MDNVEKALKQAIDSLSIDDLAVTKEQVEILKVSLNEENNSSNVVNKLVKLSDKGKSKNGTK